VKVRAENLYYLLSYAWRCFEEAEVAAISAEADASAEQILVRALCSSGQRLLGRRLDRGYREERDELRRPRGRIDVSLAIARSSRARGVLPCTFDELTADVLHNQIIKSMLVRVSAAEGIAERLRLGARALVARMTDVATIPVSEECFRRVQLGGHLRQYRLPLAICALLQRCLLPHPTTGAWQLQTFTGDERQMGLLFESYVRAFLEDSRDPFPEVGRSRLRWRVEGDALGLLPGMETDVTLRRPGQTAILETKCYAQALVSGPHGAVKRLRSENINQLAAYLANVEAPPGRLTGVLLYAVDQPTIPPARFRLGGVEVLVRELNLAQPWQAIEHDLRELAVAIAAHPPPQANPVAARSHAL
jgi:5-methylcytosine-specific restriction enzyme subunit McrC